MSDLNFEAKYGPERITYGDDNPFIDDEAVVEAGSMPAEHGDEKVLLNALYTVLNIVKSHNPDAQILSRFKTFPRFRAHIIKLAKNYLKRGGYTPAYIKRNAERIKPLLEKHFFKRKNKKGQAFKWIEDKQEILNRSDPKHIDLPRFQAMRDNKENFVASSECQQLEKLGLIDDSTVCQYQTRLARKNGLIKPTEKIFSSNFDCILYPQITKAGKYQYRIKSICSLCGHPKNIIVSQKRIKAARLS